MAEAQVAFDSGLRPQFSIALLSLHFALQSSPSSDGDLCANQPVRTPSRRRRVDGVQVVRSAAKSDLCTDGDARTGTDAGTQAPLMVLVMQPP